MHEIYFLWLYLKRPPLQKKKWSFPLTISSVNVTNPQFNADLVTFTEEIL